MGNSKFKLSDIIPNAWFYKLRYMGKNNTYSKKKPHNTPSSSSSLSNSSSLVSSSIFTASNSTSIPPKYKQPQISHHRQSNYFTRELYPEDSNFPILETKLPISPIKSPKQRIRNRGNGASSQKLNSSVLNSSDSESSFSITNFKSFDSNFEASQYISENKSSNFSNGSQNIKIRNKGNTVLSKKQNSPVSVTSDFGNFFCHTSFISPATNSNEFEMISETKLPNSPIRSPKQGIRNTVLCDKPKSQVPISSDSENSIFDNNFQNFVANSNEFHPISKAKPPPINTKKKTEVRKEKKINAPRKQRSTPAGKHTVNSTGVRLRLNSPRIGKFNENGRKSFSSGRQRRLPDSFALVKSSSNPQKDFKESMVEMILQNNINNSKEMEDLLACYLELNCDEYHDLIIKVFKQIWVETAIVRV